MGEPITRRRYLAAVSGTVTLAGCGGTQDSSESAKERPAPISERGTTLVVYANSTTTVSSTRTPITKASATSTETTVATPTSTTPPAGRTTEPEPGQSQQSGEQGQQPRQSQPQGPAGTTTPTPTPGDGGQVTTSDTPSPTTTSASKLIIRAGETAEVLNSYEQIRWQETGQLVIENGAGLTLREADA